MIGGLKVKVASLTEALRGLVAGIDAATEPYDDCHDCAAVNEWDDRENDSCALHSNMTLWQAYRAALEALGPCWCGHTLSQHHDEDSTSCKACVDCSAFKHPASAALPSDDSREHICGDPASSCDSDCVARAYASNTIRCQCGHPGDTPNCPVDHDQIQHEHGGVIKTRIEPCHCQSCKDMPDVLEAALSEDSDLQLCRDALWEIVECRSAYSLDPLERAVNAVEHCQLIAMRALRVGPFATTEGGKP